jgi:hypothetical protein
MDAAASIPELVGSDAGSRWRALHPRRRPRADQQAAEKNAANSALVDTSWAAVL